MTEATPLLDPDRDPPPVEVIEASSRPDILLVCEHAGRVIPHSLGDLGVSASDMDRHIAYDIGAEAVARSLAQKIGAALVLQRYSRLVIDCNRPPKKPQSIPEISDATQVPANLGLTEAEQDERVAAIFAPYRDAVLQEIGRPEIRRAYSIHSFTPVLGGVARPWDIGFCAREEGHVARLADNLVSSEPELSVAVNQPYQIDDETDWFVPYAAEPAGVLHALIEIRNDRITEMSHAEAWANRLAPILTETE